MTIDTSKNNHLSLSLKEVYLVEAQSLKEELTKAEKMLSLWELTIKATSLVLK